MGTIAGGFVRARRLIAGAAVVLSILCGLVWLGAPAAHAATATAVIDGITYQVDDSDPGRGARVTDYDSAGYGPSVVIPSEVTIGGQRYAVTTVATFAFSRKALVSVSIPDSVTTIESFAFEENALTEVELPHSLTSLGNFAFEENQLESLVIPDSLTTIEWGAFNSNRLRILDLGNSVQTIRNFAFFGNGDLSEVTVPASVTSIGSRALVGNHLFLTFLGDAPAISPAGDEGSFGGPTAWSSPFCDKVMYVQPGASGFTRPTWQGYRVEDVGFRVGIEFDTRGGAPLASVELPYCSPFPVLATPTRDGFAFDAWYVDPEATEYFSTPGTHITQSYKLYAGWTPVASTSHEVTFDSRGGSAVAAVRVEDGEAVVEPAAPSRDGFAFTGWYTDAAATSAYDFGLAITGDLALYAGWRAVPALPSEKPDTPRGTDSRADGPAQATAPGRPTEALARTGGSSNLIAFGLSGLAILAAAGALLAHGASAKR